MPIAEAVKPAHAINDWELSLTATTTRKRTSDGANRRSITVNRHERRASVRSIRHSDLITHLTAADVPLDDHAVPHGAVLHWYSNIAARKPVCIGCKASFRWR
jgi:hypothetical protein